MTVRKSLQMTLVVAALVAGSVVLRAQSRANEHWVGTWATAEVGRPQNPAPAVLAPAAAGQSQTPPAAPAPFLHFNNQTLRQIVHSSIGGSRLRIVLSNRFGTAPLTIAAAHVALRQKESAIVAGSDRVLMFSGRPTMTIPPGALVYSDPVDLNLPPVSDLAIDLYLPGDTNAPSPV